MKYPENIKEKLADKIDLQAVDALSLAKEAGSIKAVNVVLIGLLAKSMNVDKQVWIDVIKETVPEKFIEMNLKAFEIGYTINK
jgi:indolepyruvate ferredoxin oxidoreductase beta subunit